MLNKVVHALITKKKNGCAIKLRLFSRVGFVFVDDIVCLVKFKIENKIRNKIGTALQYKPYNTIKC